MQSRLHALCICVLNLADWPARANERPNKLFDHFLANFSTDRRRRRVTELTPGAGARRERFRVSARSDNLRAPRSTQRFSVGGTLVTSTVITVIATTQRRFLRVVAFQFGDQVHVVATHAHARSNRAVVRRQPPSSPFLQQMKLLCSNAVVTRRHARCASAPSFVHLIDSYRKLSAGTGCA